MSGHTVLNHFQCMDLNQTRSRKTDSHRVAAVHYELVADVLNMLLEFEYGMKLEAKGFSTLPLEVRSGAAPFGPDASPLLPVTPCASF